MEISEESGNKTAKPVELGMEIKTETVTLADGKSYELAPLTLNTLCRFEEKFPEGDMGELLKTGRFKYVRYLAWLRIQPHHPEITEEQVGSLITAGILANIQDKLYN
jgi:hypothetical protein